MASLRPQEDVLKHHRRSAFVRRGAFVAAAALVTATLVAGLSRPQRAAAVENYPVPATGSYALSGHGYGHGRGMSQWGAYGMAVEGQSATQILDFYYPGTQTSTIANTTTIRVLLSAADGTDLTITAGLGNESVVDTAHGNVQTALPATVNNATVTMWRALRTAGSIALQGFWNNAWQAYPTSAPLVTTGPLQFSSDTASLRLVYPDNTAQAYQGTLTAAISGSTLLAIDTLPMESYVDGVVPHEAINSWPAAALQAQAIAARSYAAEHLGGAGLYDICDTTQCQVYLGTAHYTAAGAPTATQFPESDAAVAATANQVLTLGGKPILAEYSSSNGGWSVAGGLPYEIAQADPWDHYSPDHDWTATLTQAQIQAAYPSIGTLTALTVNQRDGNGDWGGRVLSVTLQGSATSLTISGTAFQAAMGLKSTWWTVGAGSTTLPADAGYLHTMSPARLLDTRTNGNTPFGAAQTRSLAVAGAGGVPADAVGVVLNVTATDTSGASFLTVWPTAGTRPNTSNLNWDRKGQTVANLVYTELGSDGGVDIYNNQGSASVIVDVFGYFEPASAAGGLGFEPLTPSRILDTRIGVGGPVAPIGAHATRSLLVAGSGGVAAAAQAVVANLTVTRPTAESYLTVWPAGTPQPATSNINMLAKDTRANAALATLGGGSVSIYNNLGNADAILDVLGEYLPADGTTGQYVGIQPARLLDTRTSTGGHPQPMAAGETYGLPVLGRGGVPATGVSAVVLNVTAVAPNAPTYVTAWASGGARPGISNLNAGAGTVVPNLVITGVGPDGKVDLYNDQGSAGLVVDVVGWIS